MSIKLHDLYTRTKGFGKGPQRTQREMAEEFGVSCLRLGILLKKRNGPVGRKLQGKFTGRQTWYYPADLRAWWASLPEAVRKPPGVQKTKT